MIAAMAGFAAEDAVLKGVAGSLPVSTVLIWFGMGGAAIFAVLARARREHLVPARAAMRLWLRAAFEIAGRLFYTLAFVLTPLSSATAILQAAPIVVVAGASLIWGERIGWRRGCAIAAGLLGVLIVLRPWQEGVTALSWLAVLGMIGFAGRDLATRASAPAVGTMALGVWGFAAIIAAGLGLAVFEGTWPPLPGAREAGVLALASLIGVVAYGCLTRAMATGEVSAVTPFRYSRLLFGILLGVAVFGERPDAAVYLGSAVIVLSGLFIFARTPPQPPR